MQPLTSTQFHAVAQAAHADSLGRRGAIDPDGLVDLVIDRVTDRLAASLCSSPHFAEKMASALEPRVWAGLPAAARRGHLRGLTAKQACALWPCLDPDEKALCRRLHGSCACAADCNCRGPKKGAVPGFVTKTYSGKTITK